jgi:hypothetical protein
VVIPAVDDQAHRGAAQRLGGVQPGEPAQETTWGGCSVLDVA